MKISIIIPNYNGKNFLKDCLDSLQTQTFKDFDIIIVDNDSKDDSVDFVSSNYSDVKIIKLDKNYGFSKAVNEGIKASTADYVILLNNDTKSDKNFVLELYNAISKDKRIFSVASKMIQFHNPTLLDSAGDLYTVVGWGINRGCGRHITSFDKPSEIFSSCAGAAIYNKAVFDEIGFFDENHFAYLEDIDIGYRALRYGYKNYYEPKAMCYHYGSGSSGSKYNDFKIRLSSRNSVFLNYKNMTLLQKIINFIPLVMGSIFKLLFFVKKGYGKIYVLGLIEGMKNRKNLNKPPYKLSQISNYILIELKLIKYTFVYAIDWIKRKLS